MKYFFHSFHNCINALLIIILLVLSPGIIFAESTGGAWQFDTTYPSDSSGNGNDGVLSGDATIINGGLKLSGNGFMTVHNSSSLSPTNSLFIECDVLFDKISSDWIIDNISTDYKKGYLLRTYLDTSELLFYLGLGNDTVVLRAKVEAGVTYRVLVIYDGSSVALYLNGLLQDYSVKSGTISYDNTYDIYFGSNKGKGQFLKGTLDNIRIGCDKKMPLTIASRVFPGGKTGTPFRWQVDAFGGFPPYVWSASGLPKGLSILSNSGVIEGTVEGDRELTFEASIRVTDSSELPDSSSSQFASTFLHELSDTVSFVSGNGDPLHALTVQRTGPQLAFYAGQKKGYYAVYQNLSLNPEVVFFDSKDKKWSLPVRAGTSPLKNDRHGHPAITVDQTGFIHVFYGAHFSPLKHAVSKTRESIDEWISLPDVTSSATYPNVMTFHDGEMLLFYRPNIDYGLRRSTDNGNTWSAEQIIVDWGSNYAIYPDTGIAVDQDRNVIHFCWSVYNYTKKKHQGLYYTKSSDRGLSWYTSAGKRLNNPITATESEVVYYKEDEITYGEDISYDKDGRPIILFTTKKIEAQNAFYKIAVYSNKSWNIIDLIETVDVNISGALYFDRNKNSFFIYLVNTDGKLEEWTGNTVNKVTLNKVIYPSENKTWTVNAPRIALDDNGRSLVLFKAYFDQNRSYIFSHSYADSHSNADSDKSDSGGGCFIATAAYGSPMAEQVEILRQFRDRYLLTNNLGRKFVVWYYSNGPVAANFIKDKPSIKAAVRVVLYPLIGFSSLLISGYLPFVIVGLILSAFLFLRFRPKKLPVKKK